MSGSLRMAWYALGVSVVVSLYAFVLNICARNYGALAVSVLSLSINAANVIVLRRAGAN